jgi:diacylglycerol kinase
MKKYVIERLKSFIPAFQGIIQLIRYEKNAILHLIATIFVVIISWLLSIDRTEWLFLFLAIFLVWITELINTSIEKLTDKAYPEFHPQAKIIKDFSAGAVLMAAIFSIIVAIFIFLPKLF